MEECSEKSKRGRPAKYEDWYIEALSKMNPSSIMKTKRGIIERYLWLKAWGVIREAYLASPEENRWAEYFVSSDGNDSYHKSILAALGRFEDDEESILSCARTIGENKIPTHTAVARIRKARLGKEPESDGSLLFEYLQNAVINYSEIHPSFNKDQIIRVLRTYADILEDQE